MKRLAVLLLLGFAVLAAPAHSEPIVADFSRHRIAIGSGFTGESVVLFGATDGPGDVIAVVRGPERDLTVWHKEKVAGIWVNGESATFLNVPSYYAVVASRPIADILTPAAAALHHIGIATLPLETSRPMSPERRQIFLTALIETQQRGGLFTTLPGRVVFLGDRLFRATISFPTNVPTGTYLCEIFLARDRDVVGGQTAPLVVQKIGLDAAVSDFATHQAALYGAIAVLTAVVAGWVASVPFRGT